MRCFRVVAVKDSAAAQDEVGGNRVGGNDRQCQ